MNKQAHTIPRVAKLCWGGYPVRSGLSILLLFATGVTGGLSIAAVVPLMQSLTDEAPDRGGVVDTVFRSIFATLRMEMTFLNMLLLVFAIVCMRAAGMTLLAFLASSVEVSIERDKKQELFNRLLRTQLTYLYTCDFGRLTDVIITQTRMMGRLLLFLSRFTTSIMDMAFALCVILLISWKLTVCLALFSIGLYALLKPILWKAKGWGMHAARCQGHMQTTVGSALNGYKTFKSYARETLLRRQLKGILAKYRRARIKLRTVEGALNALFEPLVLLIAILFFLLFEFELAVFMAFIVAASRMYMSIRVIQNMHYKITTHSAALDLYSTMLDELTRHQYPDEHVGEEFAALHDGVEFRQVSFRYDVGDTDIHVGPLDARIPKGTTIAFVGESGSGKSTTVDLLEGLLRPQSGQILIDGKDLAAYRLTSFRRKVAYVSQDTFLLNDTVQRNIDFAEEGIGKDDVMEASRLADADEFIQKLPEKYDTLLGEQGARLSGGQRQRIALARALALKPEILILDEATSALDNESEKRIQSAIDGSRGRMTIIVIAHRLTTVRHADYIYVFDDGKIAESGDFDGLLARRGIFRRMYNAIG